jgi:uncharacterized sulfatase
MIEYVDVTPTFIEMAGLNVSEDLDGESFLPILTEEKNVHKKFVYGIQTTRGINKGSEYYGVRTVRSETYRYILNLTPEATFQNNIIVDNNKNTVFKSWEVKGITDSLAKDLTYRYQHRPAEELYDVVNDPFEMNNIAENPKYSTVKEELKNKLLKWMNQQGDEGQQTEMEALEHQWKRQKK